MLDATIERLKGKRKIVVMHRNADMDALGSAYAIAKCFPEADIFAPGSLNHMTKVVVEKLGIKVLENCDVSAYEQIVVVDCSSPDQTTTDTFSLPENCIAIDHHIPTGKWDENNFYCDSSKVACVQIFLDVIRKENIKIDRDLGLVLLLGMLTDSGHFQFSNPVMLRDFAYVLEETGIGIDEVMNLAKNDISMSERVSVLKCVQRAKFERVGDMIVATSSGSSYEASGCFALIAAGADVAFVASQRDDNFRLSSRATQKMVRRGINLGEMVKSVGTDTISDGGGHEGAAGLSGNGDAEAILHICMEKMMEQFREIKKKMELENPGNDSI